MRILLTCIEEPSHLRTMVPLAWGLMAAGHDVRAAGGPGITTTILEAGIPSVTVGIPSSAAELLSMAADQGDSLENELTDWTRPQDTTEDWETALLRYQVAVPMAFALYNDPMVEDLVDLARDWRPDLILWESLTYAGAIAAAASGIPHARVNWMHDIYGAMRETSVARLAEQPEEDREDPLREWFESHLHPYGAEFEEHLVSGLWTFDLIPPSQQFTTSLHRVPVRPLAYTSKAALPLDVPERGVRPRVCLTAGVSLQETFGVDFLDVETIADALADLDVEIVAAIPPEQAAAWIHRPANVIHAGFVPLNFLLSSCSAVLHHGGFGTWAHALAAGIPQHITAICHGDLTIKGDYLVKSGAGILRHPSHVSPGQLREDVTALVSDSAYQSAATALADEVRAIPSPAEIAANLAPIVEAYVPIR